MAAPPAQYAQWSAPAAPADTAHDEVRTIFVLGFPPDVKERELQNLLRWWPGYEASQMNFKGDQPMGFALFSTAAMAMAARDALQNLVFDSETNSVLRAEMAKKNLYVKRGNEGPTANPHLGMASLNVEVEWSSEAGGSEPATYDPSKRMRTGGDYSAPQYAAPSAFVPPAAPSWGPQSYIPPTAPYDPYGGYSVAQVPPVAPAGYAPVQNTKDNPPCNTLFIGNLGEATSEAELRGLFSGQPGFRQMKVLRQGKSTVCFIEFGDVSSAMAVHQNLQGAVLTTSDRGGMRIQYSKNPYGRKREGMGPGPQQSDGVVAPTQLNQAKLETPPAAVPELNGGSEVPSVPVLPAASIVQTEQAQAV